MRSDARLVLTGKRWRDATKHLWRSLKLETQAGASRQRDNFRIY